MVTDKKLINGCAWRRINMRTVGHLIGVEFIHDLYNRHVQRINFIRFRNTITTWHNGIVNSYAPENEFEAIEKWFGEKFYKLDKVLLREFATLLDSDRSFFDEQMQRFQRSNLSKLTNFDIGLLLMDVQQFSLGELYKMNFVQAEYALTSAIKRILRECCGNNENIINEIFSKIIASDRPTESQEEEMAFMKLLSIKRKLEEPLSTDTLRKIKKHHLNFSYMHSAYGEEPYSLDYYVDKWKQYDPKTNVKTPTTIKKDIKALYLRGKNELDKLKNRKLSTLVPLMIIGGTFRDRNKASLGYTIKYKHIIFNEIALRKLEDRDSLNYYLLSEMLALLSYKEKVDRKVINDRKKFGVVLVRSEYLNSAKNFESLRIAIPPQKNTIQRYKELRGRCACGGHVEGTAKIVFKKSDSAKVKTGDIMVAIGTDFDLMDAIHRSAGIITEEGGLLSHASVVSREMSKPCLIGVENATTVIRDGDSIVLDSQNGIIKIK
jgi:phosphohistidine swiveling domain-containing protein